MLPCGTGLRRFVVRQATSRRLFVPHKNSWRPNPMARDPIVDEVRQFRDDYSQRFYYDLEAICRDIRIKQAQGGRKVVSLPPKPVQTPSVPKKQPVA